MAFVHEPFPPPVFADIRPEEDSAKLLAELGSVPVVPHVFDTESAARYVCVSRATLELLRVRGGGPAFVKLNRLVRYRRAALDEWLLSRERRTTSDSDGGAQ